jgi:hypothetical protein
MMNDELLKKYGKAWRVFIKIVKDFDDYSWLHTGRGQNNPARLALHILQSTAYYLQDSSLSPLSSGKPFTSNCWNMANRDIPRQGDIVDYIHTLEGKTENWLKTRDLGAENLAFEWAGNTNAGVILFSFQHCMFHLGELSCLLNESKNGNVEDHYIDA